MWDYFTNDYKDLQESLPIILGFGGSCIWVFGGRRRILSKKQVWADRPLVGWSGNTE